MESLAVWRVTNMKEYHYKYKVTAMTQLYKQSMAEFFCNITEQTSLCYVYNANQPKNLLFAARKLYFQNTT